MPKLIDEHMPVLKYSARQTADTFLAAATFLELCQIWGPLEPEIASKIKFAKFHSVRILKAMKAGEDPNLSNPEAEPVEPPLDPDDPELSMLTNSGTSLENSNDNMQPTVTEVPDEHDISQPYLAQSSNHDQSLHPSRAPSVPPAPSTVSPAADSNSVEGYYQSAAPPEVSPLDQPRKEQATNGGYFPDVPATMAQNPDRIQSPVHHEQQRSPPEVRLPDSSALPPPASGFHTSLPPPANSLHAFGPPSIDDPNVPPSINAIAPNNHSRLPSAPRAVYPDQPPANPPGIPQTSPQNFSPAPGAPAPRAAPIRRQQPPQAVQQTDYVADEEAILKAQKHARWAISALNFEDVNTAVKELRGALESLGA